MNIKKLSWARPLAFFMALTMIMMYSVSGMAFAVADTIDVPLKDVHVGASWKSFNHDCDGVEVPAGKVLWHLVASPLKSGAMATIKVNGEDVVGEQMGNGGGAMHWTLITDDLMAPAWVATFTSGLESNTDLRVSHTCYGGSITPDITPTPGSITVNKTFSDCNLSEVTIVLKQGSETIRTGSTSGQTITFEGLTPGAYTIEESGSPANYTVAYTGGNTVTLDPAGEVTKEVTNSLKTGGNNGGNGNNGGSDLVNVPEVKTPTTSAPVIEPDVQDNPEVIIEGLPVPKADVPQTGNADNIWLLLGLMIASGLGLGTLGRRKETGTK